MTDVEKQEVAVAVAVPTYTSPVMLPPGASVVTRPRGASGTTPSAPGTSNKNSGVPMWQQDKEGSKCCGCCCDYRRAVIILNVISIILAIAFIIIAVTATNLPTAGTDIDDDEILDIFQDSLTTQAIYSGITLFCAICAVVGANKYNIYLVGFNVVWLVVGMILGIVTTINTFNDVNSTDPTSGDLSPTATIVQNVVFTVLIVYPHIGFIYEVKTGIMNFETYPREEFSCCCAPRGTR